MIVSGTLPPPKKIKIKIKTQDRLEKVSDEPIGTHINQGEHDDFD